MRLLRWLRNEDYALVLGAPIFPNIGLTWGCCCWGWVKALVEPNAPWGFINAVVSQKRTLTIIISSGSAKCRGLGLSKGSRLLLWLLLRLLILLTPARREHYKGRMVLSSSSTKLFQTPSHTYFDWLLTRAAFLPFQGVSFSGCGTDFDRFWPILMHVTSYVFSYASFARTTEVYDCQKKKSKIPRSIITCMLNTYI